MGSHSHVEIVSADWWESYWQDKLSLPKTFNPSAALDRCIARTVERFLTPDRDKSMVEVGCCPGKWMAYFHGTFGYRVSGIDYLPAGIEYTKQNLALNHVDYEELICDDIFELQTERRFDVVFSVGFIEHFTDVTPVLKSHLHLAAPGGYVIVGMPRFRSIVYVLQSLFDAVSQNKILPRHNLDVMKLSPLRDFAVSKSLRVLFLDYIAGFLPVLLKPGDAGPAAESLRNLLIDWRERNAGFLDEFNNSLVSNYILAVFQKPE
jgi:2-polyprenyl-3-methyl-5-hydroxy-6-metoxy-1,4-benzoquinol methylase